MALCTILVAMFMSFDIGPTAGALLPVQDEGGPWRTSFVLGVKARYGMGFGDLETELSFSQLGIDPDSSRGFEYSMVPFTLGISGHVAGMRAGLGAAVYTIEARLEIDDGLAAVWEGSYPGMYAAVGRDFPLISGTADLTARFHIIDFDALWIGLTGSILF